MSDKIVLKAITEDGENDMKIGKYEASSIQPIIDLFLKHEWLDAEGEVCRAQRVLLVVHDFMPFHIELSSE